ncbi:flagellin N-terminal helical domain-containing protein [Aeromonas caviae]|uniref:flagellin N-terminal helical domain-containing protein n=1 Tax=Aeromonas caviae TaxID=648 RepID=UPI002B45CA60|nr:flagellin [Aeromonas caviae]
MSLYINTNVSSLNAQRNMMNSTKSLDTSYTRLASGLRINSAKDDAAGLQISNRLTSQINGLDQGNRNANDGISLAQTAEGALDETTSMLQRMRTLAQQSANGTNSSSDRVALQAEYTQLSNEINRIAKDTTFGGQNLLNGATTNNFQFQVGANSGQAIAVNLSSNSFGVDGLAKQTTGWTKVTSWDTATSTYTTSTETGKLTWNDIKSISSMVNAQTVLKNIDNLISSVDSTRATLGAVQNRLDSTVRNQANISENVSAARSRIRDADFATETANMTKQNILQQAASSVLAQANQRPQAALSLLG